MGLRYRRSVKICKGVRMNFSKSGPSITLGTRGAHYTIGSNGRRTATVGIPGTGISYSQTTRGSTNKKTTATHKSTNTQSSNFAVKIGVDLDGQIVFLDENNEQIIDQSIIRRAKSTDYYKKMKPELERAQQEAINQRILSQQNELDEFINMQTHVAKVYEASYYQKKLERLETKSYSKKEYSIPEPSVQEIKDELTAEAVTNVKTIAIWNLTKLRNEYVEKNLNTRYSERKSIWENNKKEFDLQEKINEENFNKQIEIEKEELKLAIEGNEDLVCRAIDNWISEHILPVEININYEYNHSLGDIFLDVDLPEIEDLPTTEYTVLASGKLKEKNKTQKKLKEEYAQMVFGLVIYLCGSIFNISPNIRRILISGYTQRIIDNRTKEIGDDYIFSIRINRSNLEHLKLKEINSIKTCLELDCRCSLSQAMTFKTIIPFNSFDD